MLFFQQNFWLVNNKKTVLHLIGLENRIFPILANRNFRKKKRNVAYGQPCSLEIHLEAKSRLSLSYGRMKFWNVPIAIFRCSDLPKVCTYVKKMRYTEKTEIYRKNIWTDIQKFHSPNISFAQSLSTVQFLHNFQNVYICHTT